MNEKNLAYLKSDLKFLGFGENLNPELERQVGQGHKEFTLNLQTEINKHPFSALLHFRKGDNTDLYFLNKWDAALKTDVGKEAQTFYVNKGHGVTLKEGYNLLEGRAVFKELSDKEGQKYHAWLQLDKTTIDPNKNYKVSQYHENYGFDLEKALSVFPIKELGDATQRGNLKRSLERGNLQAVSFEKNGFVEKLFIEASPRFKSINVYDQKGERLTVPNLEKRFDFHVKPDPTTDVTLVGSARQKMNHKEVPPKAQGEAKKEEAVPEKTKHHKESVAAKAGPGDGLLEKKRSAPKKGQHL
jgi:hypothetical protein